MWTEVSERERRSEKEGHVLRCSFFHRDALNVRKVAIMDSDSESDSDSDDDEDWLDEELEEYEDLLDMMNTPVNV